MSWYVATQHVSANATADRNKLVVVDLSAAAGNVVITGPADTTDPTYFGVVNGSAVASGAKVIDVNDSGGGFLQRISGRGEAVWFARDATTGIWGPVAQSQPTGYQWIFATADERVACQSDVSQLRQYGFQSDIGLAFELLQSGGTKRWGQLPPTDVAHWRELATQYASTTLSQYGMTTDAPSGLSNAITPTSGSKSNNLIRLGIQAAAGGYAARRFAAPSGLFNDGGWRVQMQTTLVTMPGANTRWFVGMTTSAPAGAVNPDTFLHAVGIGRTAGQANLQLMHNDGAGTCTLVDLGASFPAATVGTYYTLDLYTLDGTSYVAQILNVATRAETSRTLSANIPGSTQNPAWLYYCDDSGAVSSISAANLKLGQLYR